VNEINIIILGISLVFLFLSICIVFISRKKTKTTIKNLNDMLDKAISGEFSNFTYDESMLSALEAKLNRFLSMSLHSKSNLSKEKARIKALISDISHQTKTPISNILLYSQLLNEQKQLPSESSEMLNQIVVQGEKLDFLIQALVKTSRLETDIITIVPKSNSVLNLVTDVYKKMKNNAEKKNIEVKTVGEDDLAIFDKKWTEEALFNILDNAIKYTSNNGCIIISIMSYEIFSRIDITDNGIGIREEDINTIFKRFYRSIDVNQYEGVGIGLFLAREIITKQSGYIKVSSELGKGSTFSIFLPK